MSFEVFSIWLGAALLSMAGVGLVMSTVLLLLSGFAQRRLPKIKVAVDQFEEIDDSLPRITVTIPAYNEGPGIVAAARAALASFYPDLEVIVVDDGSKDDTFAKLQAEFFLEPDPDFEPPASLDGIGRGVLIRSWISASQPGLRVLQQTNGGKASGQNAGLKAATGEYFCVIDGDTLLAPDALLLIARDLARKPHVAGIGGTLLPANGMSITAGSVRRAGLPNGVIARAQMLEYFRSFHLTRFGLSSIGAGFIVAGAFGMFRVNALRQAGGYPEGSLAEDYRASLNLIRLGPKTHQLALNPQAIAYTEVPSSLRMLWKQRIRWQMGAVETLWAHRRDFLNPRRGRFGLTLLPVQFIIDIAVPIMSFLGYVVLAIAGSLSIHGLTLLGALWLAESGIAIYVSGVALMIGARNRDPGLPPGRLRELLNVSAIESMGIRQVIGVARVYGTIKYLFGARTWASIPRVGLEVDSDKPARAARAQADGAAEPQTQAGPQTLPMPSAEPGAGEPSAPASGAVPESASAAERAKHTSDLSA